MNHDDANLDNDASKHSNNNDNHGDNNNNSNNDNEYVGESFHFSDLGSLSTASSRHYLNSRDGDDDDSSTTTVSSGNIPDAVLPIVIDAATTMAERANIPLKPSALIPFVEPPVIDESIPTIPVPWVEENRAKKKERDYKLSRAGSTITMGMVIRGFRGNEDETEKEPAPSKMALFSFTSKYRYGEVDPSWEKKLQKQKEKQQQQTTGRRQKRQDEKKKSRSKRHNNDHDSGGSSHLSLGSQNSSWHSSQYNAVSSSSLASSMVFSQGSQRDDDDDDDECEFEVDFPTNREEILEQRRAQQQQQQQDNHRDDHDALELMKKKEKQEATEVDQRRPWRRYNSMAQAILLSDSASDTSSVHLLGQEVKEHDYHVKDTIHEYENLGFAFEEKEENYLPHQGQQNHHHHHLDDVDDGISALDDTGSSIAELKEAQHALGWKYDDVKEENDDFETIEKHSRRAALAWGAKTAGTSTRVGKAQQSIIFLDDLAPFRQGLSSSDLKMLGSSGSVGGGGAAISNKTSRREGEPLDGSDPDFDAPFSQPAVRRIGIDQGGLALLRSLDSSFNLEDSNNFSQSFTSKTQLDASKKSLASNPSERKLGKKMPIRPIIEEGKRHNDKKNEPLDPTKAAAALVAAAFAAGDLSDSDSEDNNNNNKNHHSSGRAKSFHASQSLSVASLGSMKRSTSYPAPQGGNDSLQSRKQSKRRLRERNEGNKSKQQNKGKRQGGRTNSKRINTSGEGNVSGKQRKGNDKGNDDGDDGGGTSDTEKRRTSSRLPTQPSIDELTELRDDNSSVLSERLNLTRRASRRRRQRRDDETVSTTKSRTDESVPPIPGDDTVSKWSMDEAKTEETDDEVSIKRPFDATLADNQDSMGRSYVFSMGDSDESENEDRGEEQPLQAGDIESQKISAEKEKTDDNTKPNGNEIDDEIRQSMIRTKSGWDVVNQGAGKKQDSFQTHNLGLRVQKLFGPGLWAKRWWILGVVLLLLVAIGVAVPFAIIANQPTPTEAPSAAPSVSPTIKPPRFDELANILGVAAGDMAGSSISLSADGSIVAVSYRQDSTGSGQVRIFRLEEDGTLFQLGKTIDGQEQGDLFGYAISMASDGREIVIGAPLGGEDGHGYAQVFTYDQPRFRWVQRGNTLFGNKPRGRAGNAVAISGDGKRVALGAPTSTNNDGEAWVFEYGADTETWTRVGQRLRGVTDSGELNGFALSLSAGGSVLAIGRVRAPSNDDNLRGRVTIMSFFRGQWGQVGNDISGLGDLTGRSVALSGDGLRVAIGSTGFDTSLTDVGMCQVFEFQQEGNWTAKSQILQGDQEGERSGFAVSLSLDGRRVACAGPGASVVRVFEDPQSGNENSNSTTTWELVNDAVLSDKENGTTNSSSSKTNFGNAVSMDFSGNVLAIGAPAAGIGGGSNVGIVHIYRD